MMSEDFWGEPIYAYTTEQAIEDGVLVHFDVNRWPWLLMTASVWADVVAAAVFDEVAIEARAVPLMIDCVGVAQENDESLRTLNAGEPLVLKHTLAGDVWVMLNDKGGLTIMKPEDY